MKGYLLDTNVFNHLLDGKLEKSDLPTDYPVFISHIQEKELSNTPNPARRADLLLWLRKLDVESIPTSTWVLGATALGQARMGNGAVLHKITRRLNAIKPKRVSANINDGLIGEVAIEGQYILITNDGDLGDVVRSLGGCVLDLTGKKTSC